MNFKNNRRRIWWLSLGTLLVAGVITTAVLLNARSSADEYMTARVDRGSIRYTVSATGTLQAVTTVQVGSQVSGTISALYADFNSTVKKGQLVAQLDPALFAAQVASARANVGQARASLADANARVLTAQSNIEGLKAGVSSSIANLAALKASRDDSKNFYDRQKSLATSGLITQHDLDTAKNNYDAAEARYQQANAQLSQARVSEQGAAGAGLEQAKAQVEQARAQVQQNEAALKLAEVNLSHATITSPIDGVVVSRNVDVGQTVAASLQAPTLFTIANDLTEMQVIANIDQADIGVINASAGIVFTVDAFPGQNFKGKIEQIRLNPTNNQNVVTYNVVIDVDNPELKLKPGMTANLTFTIAESNNVLKIPNAALRFTPAGMTPEKIREIFRASRGGASGPSGASGAAGSPEVQGSPGGEAASGGQRRQGGGGQGGQGGGPGGQAGQGGQGGGRPGGGSGAATSAVLKGQTRVVWRMGPDKKPQPVRIKLGITDGKDTEVAEGDLKEGDTIIVGQTISADNRGQSTRPPGFGGPGGFGGGGGGGRPR
jgi:HlyD family secretion protein